MKTRNTHEGWQRLGGLVAALVRGLKATQTNGGPGARLGADARAGCGPGGTLAPGAAVGGQQRTEKKTPGMPRKAEAGEVPLGGVASSGENENAPCVISTPQTRGRAAITGVEGRWVAVRHHHSFILSIA